MSINKICVHSTHSGGSKCLKSTRHLHSFAAFVLVFLCFWSSSWLTRSTYMWCPCWRTHSTESNRYKTLFIYIHLTSNTSGHRAIVPQIPRVGQVANSLKDLGLQSVIVHIVRQLQQIGTPGTSWSWMILGFHHKARAIQMHDFMLALTFWRPQAFWLRISSYIIFYDETKIKNSGFCPEDHASLLKLNNSFGMHKWPLQGG